MTQKKKTSKNKKQSPNKTVKLSLDASSKLFTFFQQRNFIEAEPLAKRIINEFPSQSYHALLILGAIRRQQGGLEDALSLMQQALRIKLDDSIGLRNIAVLLCELERFVEAESYCRQALAINPNYAEAYGTLSTTLKSQNKLVEAEENCRKALTLQPSSTRHLVNLGLICHEKKEYSQAKIWFHEALALDPSAAEAYCALSLTLQAQGNTTEAELTCRQALTLKPDYAAAHNFLGGFLDAQKRYKEAEIAYRNAIEFKAFYHEAIHGLSTTLLHQNKFIKAEYYCRQALAMRPNKPEIYFNLGNALAGQENQAEAIDNYTKALQLKPDYPETYINLGNSLRAQGLLAEAEICYRTVLLLHPNNIKAYNNLGNILQEQGRLDESEIIFRSILTDKPDLTSPSSNLAFSNLLFSLNYHPDKNGNEIFQEYIKFNELFGLPLQAAWKPHINNRDKNRRLKIGYVSPNFCRHPIYNFLEPLLSCHNKDLVELYAYAGPCKEDIATDRYRTYMDHWIPTQGMTDSDMAERIRADKIDILVDLAGHTGQNRLLAFAYKPAPVSLHWLDFGYTTGLTAINYYLADEALVPTESESLFSESPWKIASPCFAYRPTEGMGAVSILPAIKNGHVTFGCLSRAVRINHRTIRVWSKILKQVPESVLVINSISFKDPAMYDLIINKFKVHGIDIKQLEIGYTSPPWDILRQIDIGLDCFPHNSGTTLVENIYMGVPFITLSSRPSVGRIGTSILAGLGRPEWIAQTEEEYINKAVMLAKDLPNLAAIRANLRQEMEQSPLMDEKGFARNVEAAYREMFSKWCEEQQ
jgi:predicted O-linked N-acetylglucosamine transferase (SPINDLY family)